nr:hypothetical protein [Tanacetum cinerariifolium]
MTSFGYRLNPRYAIKDCLSCGALYTRDFCCSKGNVEDKILVPKLPKNYARCGHPVDGPYCQGCALLRKKLEEDLVTYFQDFQNTSESFDDSTNVVNAPREPFVVKQDHGVNSSQNPPHIDECFDQTQLPLFPVIHPPPQETSIKILHDQENAINSVKTFLRKFNRYSFFETPKVLLLAWDRVFEIKDAFRNKQYKPKDMQELFRKLFNNVQNIHEELAEYINTPGWNRPAFYNNGDDDDVDYTIAIKPVLSTKEPDNSLSIGDKHLDTIPAMESNEVIKSSVENLVSIPSESEGIPDTMCDVHLVNNPTPLEAKDHFEIVINFNDDISSSDDDYLYNENIEYVEALPHDSELVSLEVFPPTDRSDFTHEEFADELAHIISPPEYDCFYFRNLPDLGKWIPILNSEIRENLSSITRVNLPVEDDHFPLLAYVVWIFLAYLTYLVIPLYLYSFGNEDTIFDPGIAINRFYSFKPVYLIGVELSRNSILTIPACCDDEDDYNSTITPILSTEEPDNSLSMGVEHLDTIPATKLDEVIKSNVENLVPILSEFEGIPDTMCDVHLVNNPTPLEAKDHFEIVINSNDDISSSNDDSLYNENIKYVEASPYNSELVSLEISSGSTTTHSDISLSDYEAFSFYDDHIE